MNSSLDEICQRIEQLMPGTTAVSNLGGIDGSGPIIDVFNVPNGEDGYTAFEAALDKLGEDRFVACIINHHAEATRLYYADTVAAVLREREREKRMTECLEHFVGSSR